MTHDNCDVLLIAEDRRVISTATTMPTPTPGPTEVGGQVKGHDATGGVVAAIVVIVVVVIVVVVVAMLVTYISLRRKANQQM